MQSTPTRCLAQKPTCPVQCRAGYCPTGLHAGPGLSLMTNPTAAPVCPWGSHLHLLWRPDASSALRVISKVSSLAGLARASHAGITSPALTTLDSHASGPQDLCRGHSHWVLFCPTTPDASFTLGWLQALIPGQGGPSLLGMSPLSPWDIDGHGSFCAFTPACRPHIPRGRDHAVPV